ncbi:MAG TPA: FAD-dependent oxidoreductase [Anaerolineaceae bacterium]|nr:FAD-dependent oxidoreductase [Anaerolineaceae bacterium]
MKEQVIGNLSRRDFIKATALLTGAGLLGGCAPKVVDNAVPAASAEEVAASKDWLGVEPEIKDISETVETDVVVIGAGTGGAYVGASCCEKGLKVILLEKGTQPSTVRNDWGAIGSKWQIEGGAKGLDEATVLHYHQMYCANRIDPRLQKIWAAESAAAINWIGDLIISKGGMFDWEGGYEPDLTNPATYPKFPTGHSAFWPSPDMSTAKMMQEYITSMGGEYRFETPFIKFEHEGKKVTAAIAKNKEGKYIRFVGKKGIVLAAGGYQGNPTMLNALNPQDVMIMARPGEGLQAGDGIKACLWMGAAMDECHTTMIFDRMGLLPNETPATMTKPTLFWLGSQPWLKVNLLGERFTNESVPYDYLPHAAARQPGKCYCAIMDSTWFEQVQQFQTVGCSRIFPFPNGSPNDQPFFVPPGTDMKAIEENGKKIWQSLIDSGHLQEANTPEELAKKLNIPEATLAATVKRYNELADAGEDTDFYKDSYRLLPLKAPPYYGIRLTGMILSTMDGIRINTEMRPMDEDNVPFEGLHVIGDSSGSYFAHTYPNLFTGYCNGRNTTYARRVARILAGEPVELPKA